MKGTTLARRGRGRWLTALLAALAALLLALGMAGAASTARASTFPDVPTREGHAFAGWYSDAGLTQAYGFDTPVTADCTLYAKWDLNTYTVTFDSNGGSDVAAQTVSYGSKATEPDAPEMLDRLFAGWYADEALETPYDFENTPVTTDIALHAKWDEAQAYAVLYSDGTLCLQLGNDTDASHGDVEGTWEWDRSSNPWADDDHYDKVTSIVARDRISLSGDCSYMFSSRYSYGNLRGLPNCESMDLKKLDVSGVTSFREMFVDDAALKALDVSGWRTFRSTDFHMTFSGWDVSGGEGFDQMFLNCRFLISLNLSGWNPSSATDLSRMFINCSSLASLDLSGWDVSKATNLSFMFSGCSSLTSLDLSGSDPSSARDFQGMFFDCGSLSTVTLDAGCARIAEQLPEGPWYGADGTEYASIPDTALPGTFTKAKPAAQAGQNALSLASLDAAATFDDVAAVPEAQAAGGVADGSQGATSSDAEFEDVATEELAGSDDTASDADAVQPGESDGTDDSEAPDDAGVTEADSDASAGSDVSDAGQACTADASDASDASGGIDQAFEDETPDASEADAPAYAGQSCGANAPADGADGSQDCATDQADSQADASADFEVVDLASEEIQDLAA